MILIIILLIISLLFSVPTTDVSFHTDEVIDTIGIVIAEDCHQYGWWQDYTIYSKYTFENTDIENNEYLKQMTNEDIEALNLHIDNYEEWIVVISDDEEERDLVENYDFNREIISTEDYCYIYDNPDYPEYGYYNIYFYDTETEILYYFHNNI